MSQILGIDLSLNGTGLASIDDEDLAFPSATMTAPTPRLIRQPPHESRLWTTCVSTQYTGFERWNYILSVISMWYRMADMIVIEGYSFGSHSAHTRSIAEIGGIIRYHLHLHKKKVVEVAPNMLKRFLTEKGNADKSIVLKEVLRRYAFDTDDHNIADAFGLAKIGEAMLLGTEGLPQFQAEIIEQLQNPKVRTKRARATGRPV